MEDLAPDNTKVIFLEPAAVAFIHGDAEVVVVSGPAETLGEEGSAVLTESVGEV